MKLDSREVLYKSLAILYRYASDIAVLEYPRSIERRSIDLVVSLRNGRRALIKVTADASEVPRAEINELTSLSASMGASPLMIAEKREGEELLPGVAYEKGGVNLVSPETVEGVLSRRDPVYVYESRDSFKVKVNPERLRERRLASGLSLGDLASYLGTSRKAVYEYERGRLDPTIEKAQALIRLLGEDIVEEYDIFEGPRQPPKPRRETYDSKLEEEVAEILQSRGFTVVHARKTVLDIGGSKGEDRIVVVVKHPRESTRSLLEKCAYLSRMASVIGVERRLAIVDEPRLAKDLESEGVETVTPTELSSIMARLEARGEENSGRE
ncbi:MAG: helix-turn-helix domain-containing protein [Desulfurococcales archaeon]|nr:helix-turn-helix domain-containing protein [Desulfurococcales archaeon]